MGDEKKPWVVYLATFPPRECGIATFTKDLTSAMEANFSHLIKSRIVAMNKGAVNAYNYPEDVIFQINEANIQEYIDVAKKLNEIKEIKLLNIQHEFGIFGGEYGSYLLAFLEVIKKPVVITFHSVTPSPNDSLKRAVKALAEKSECIIVMAKKGVKILREHYGIKTDIEVIPHGIPAVEFAPSMKEKKRLGYHNKIILSSFGMINPGKGYEHVIRALPEVIRKFPNVLYLIVGETHPVVRKQEGERYRNFLEKGVRELKLEKNVKFYNKYVKLEEIVQYLKATDLFICSNKEPNQITSGTLAYAVGAGRAVVATPFLHAKELVTPQVGELAEFNNPMSFAKAILKILSSPKLKRSMEETAYETTRHMTWDNVAISYNNLFNKYGNLSGECSVKIPRVKLDHLIRLTDGFGIVQFANRIEPDTSSGYTLDDNARAMIVSSIHYSLFKDKFNIKLIRTYLNFIKHVQQDDGRLYNLVDYDKSINFEHWSEDAHGRAIWSLGFLINTKRVPKGLKDEAEQILLKSLDAIEKIKSPRAVAFITHGLYFYNEARHSRKNVKQIRQMADYLVGLYEGCASADWKWFEEYLTYSNSKLPEALFYAYLTTKERKYLKVAQSSLDFLRSITFEGEIFAPIGQNGWYLKRSQKAHFDQQPIDTASMVQTLLLANKATKKGSYLKDAITAFQWFLGKNSLNRMIYDESTGGCYDGLGESAINLNRGAESTVSYLLARLSFEKIRQP